MPQTVRPDTHTAITADHERKLRRHANVATGFDATKDPVVIGHNAFSNGTSTGALTGEIAIGRNADAEAQHAVAIGDTAQVYQTSGVAIGYGAVVNEQGGVALGQGSAVSTGGTDAIALAPSALASGDSSVAVGAAAAASGTSALAIGASASATHLLASAIGNNAATTKDRQHMIGTAGTFVEIPGDSSTHPNGLVLTDTATTTRYIVQVTSGALVLNAAP